MSGAAVVTCPVVSHLVKELELLRRKVTASDAFAEALRARPGVTPGEVYGDLLAEALNDS